MSRPSRRCSRTRSPEATCQVIEPAVADPGFASFHGTVGDGSGSEGQTALRQRTCFAAGRRGRTLNRPEVHDRLVVAARMRGVELPTAPSRRKPVFRPWCRSVRRGRRAARAPGRHCRRRRRTERRKPPSRWPPRYSRPRRAANARRPTSGETPLRNALRPHGRRPGGCRARL